MAQERLDLRKEVFNKAQYIKTINTSFDELGVTELNETLESQVSVEEFFGLYNSLFYSIPALGETNSHEYLFKTSGEYINFEEINEEIQALQAEIAQLRSDLLDAQMEAVSVQVAQSQNPESDSQLKLIQKELKVAQENLIQTSTQVSNSTITTPTSTSNGKTSIGTSNVSSY
jgi:hypothetical protein